MQTQTCGGALIAPDVVLLAAHCGDLTGLQINIGAFQTKSTDGGAEGRFCVKWIRDPNFDPDSLNSDFALCKLNRPLEIDQGKVRLELNEEPAFPQFQQNLQVMGFGWDENGMPTDSLQDIRVLTFPDNWAGCTTPETLCAGWFEDGTGPCYGDSGGPLISRSMNEEGLIVHTHVGIVSNGGQVCAQSMVPTVYARTSSRVDWIKETMCSDDFNSISCDNYSLNECGDGEINASIMLRTDDSPDDTVWFLYDANNVIMRRQFFVKNFESRQDICIKQDECFRFLVFDRSGNGISSSNGSYDNSDKYRITIDGETIFTGDGDFTATDETIFCTMTPSTSPSELPSMSPSDSPSTSPSSSPSESSSSAPSMSPTDSPSSAPSMSPTDSPSSAPSTSPSDSPSSAPSESPSRSPSVSPTESPCEDDPDFLWENKKGKVKTCETYLRNDRRREQRCRKTHEGKFVSEWCPKTCGTCGEILV